MRSGVAVSVAQWKAAIASSVNGTLPSVWRIFGQKRSRTNCSLRASSHPRRGKANMAKRMGGRARLARARLQIGPIFKSHGAMLKAAQPRRIRMNVKGQAAIVTGGASGLGGATASSLAAAGAKVAIFDLQDELGEKKAREIGGIYVKTNVSDAANTEASVKTVVEKLGAPRVTVNCAGIGRAARTISRTGPHDLAMFAQVIQVNLIGTFNVIRLASWAMSQSEPMDDGERGVIINTASVAAFDGQIGQAAYSASKGGVVGMTLPIARDLSSLGIRVCTIAPGLFLTPMMMGLSPEAQKSLGMQVPFPPRLGDPKEYAQLAMSIVANHMLNGETIRLDGAIRMAPK